jgi:hypothetical protein
MGEMVIRTGRTARELAADFLRVVMPPPETAFYVIKRGGSDQGPPALDNTLPGQDLPCG